MKDIKNEKGSLALFVTISMLFFMAFLLALFVSTTNQQKAQLAITARIKEIYEKNLDDIDEVYNNFVGTEEYIPVYTSEQLKKVGTGESVYIAEIGKYYTFNLDSKYILKNNIEFNSGKYTVLEDKTITFASDAEQWTPIGTSTNPFSGTFDGNGYKISGLYINNSSNHQGLFAAISGTVNNIYIDKSYFNAQNYVGAIVGTLQKDGIIKNCVSNIEIKCTGNYVAGIAGTSLGTVNDCINQGNITGLGKIGGIVGYIGNSDSNVSNCTNQGKINSNNSTDGVGGITGANMGTIENCSNKAVITAIGNSGGIVGINSGSITKSYNEGNIQNYNESSENLGGIAGLVTDGNIKECYNNTSVSGSSNVGGIIGKCETGETTIKIKNCYNRGTISSTKTGVGAILGNNINDNAEISNCYYLTGSATGGIKGADIEGQAEVKTSEDMKKDTFVTLLNNGENNWKIVTSKNEGYPILSWQN